MRFKITLLSFLMACSANAEVVHDAFGPIKIGERAKVVGKLTDDKPIQQARLYFKSNLSDNFSFTELDLSGSSLYASLPAPGQSMSNIEYFFAVKYGNGELEQSDVYLLNIDRMWDADAMTQYQKSLQVYSELEEDESDGLLGFVDTVATAYQYGKLLNEIGTAVELATYSNYTVVAGPSSGVATSTAAAGSGTAASSAGLGTLGWVGIGAATLAGGAALAGGGSDDEEESFDLGQQAGLDGQAGAVRVNVTWDNTDTDLDLYVLDPCGNLLGFVGEGGTNSATCDSFTGQWDVDAQGFNGTAENITWPEGAARGSYSVRLKHFSGAETSYAIRVFYGDSSNTFTGSIGGEEYRSITSFSFN